MCNEISSRNERSLCSSLVRDEFTTLTATSLPQYTARYTLPEPPSPNRESLFSGLKSKALKSNRSDEAADGRAAAMVLTAVAVVAVEVLLSGETIIELVDVDS